jgi:hypothetical protein
MNKMQNFFKMWLIPLFFIMIMAGCEDRVGVTSPSIITIPTVSSTNPANAATGVAFNQKIIATFSEAMNSTTITTATFTLMQGTSFVSGTVSYTGTTATFTPSSNLTPNTTYTATITTGAKDLEGSTLANNYVWSFTTGAAALVIPPTVISTNPVNAETGVALNQKIAATFSVAMDATTISASTFTLMQGTTSISGFVSYSGTTAIFAPSAILSPNTAYIATITTGAKDLAGNALANNYEWSFTTGIAVVVTPPIVSFTDPANSATGVALNQKLAATFSKVMDASTLTSATFILRQGTTPVSGFVSYSGTTAIFTPASNLAPNTIYTATITTGAKDLAGNALANNYVWSFTTGAAAVITPPTVISTDPINVATGVALNQKLAATFSKVMDASTLTSQTFILRQGTTPIPGFVSYSGTIAIFTPASNLAPNTVYTATITTGAKDLAGNALANNYIWSFTTGAAVVVTPPIVSSTDPASAAIGVALNQKVAATFSKTMDATTLTSATFTLKQGTTSVSGFVSYSGTTAIFSPAGNLAPNTVYTAMVTTGARDLAGNALANNYVWSFTTGAAVVVIPPTVISTDPVNLATGVALNKKIAATFSVTMDATTIQTSTFILRQGTTSVSGFVSYSGTTAIFTPASNLAPNTVYTATITTGAKDLAGNALANNYVWSFTTGAAVVVIPPTVILTDPLNLATGVLLNKQIAATFSVPMQASTFTSASFILMQGTTSVTGFVSYTGTTATFRPASNLLPNTVYTATITNDVTDLSGTAMANDYVWSFTTGAADVIILPTVTSTDPANAATGVVLNKKIAANFSKTMDATTITSSTFTLRQGTNSISGFVSYSGTNAIFAPAANLTPNTLYTATITTGAKDLTGNAIANNYVWNFTTGSAVVGIPPTIISTDPLPDAICVPLNKHVTATFSKRMDASTITTAIFTVMEVVGTTFISGTVSYSDSTATFIPLSNLKMNTTYTATITTGAKDLSGNSMISNYVWNFKTIEPFTVSLSSNPLAGGTTSGGGTFNSCSSVTVIATPNPGYAFTNWTENGLVVSTNANYTFTLNGNRALVANFEIIEYTVTLSSNPLLGGTTNGGGTFNSGASVTVTASPNVGYSFTNWTENGNPVSTNASYTFTISGNRTLVANFAVIPQYNVTLSANPPAGGNTSGGGTFNSGASVTVTATANMGYIFNNWTENGNPVSTNASYTFTITGNRTLVANFDVIIITQYSVTLSADPPAGGTTSGGGNYNSGSNVTVTASPNVGYAFINWTEGGNPVSTNASYTFVITGNRILVANFALTGPDGVNLRSAGDFAILAGSKVDGTAGVAITHIYGDVGSFPTATIVGLTAANVTGTLYTAADPIVALAKDHLTQAYNDAQSRSLDAISLPGQLGGLTLAPGLYVNSTSSGISGTGPQGILTLDAGGNPNAVWIFKMGSTLITDPGTSVVLAGGAKWENIYWSVGTSATLGTTCIFYGNILADQSITLETGATLRGRALTRIAAVTLDSNIVDKRP